MFKTEDCIQFKLCGLFLSFSSFICRCYLYLFVETVMCTMCIMCQSPVNAYMIVCCEVSMTALTDSCCVVWNRQLLDCLLANDHFINAVMSQLIGRDVTNKAYQSQVSCRYSVESRNCAG